MSREHTCFGFTMSARGRGLDTGGRFEDIGGHFKCPGNGIQMSGRMR